MTGQHAPGGIRWTPIIITLIICGTVLLMGALGGCGTTPKAGSSKASPSVSAKAAAIPTATPLTGKGTFLTAATILKADIQRSTSADSCTALGGDVDLAVNLGPYPTASVQAQWSKALHDLTSAATECVAGASSASADMQAAQGELETAMTAMGGQ